MVKRLGEIKTSPVFRSSSRSGAAAPLVGRDDELHRLTAALSLAVEGEGGTIFLTGQPGVGKTSLAREALALAKGRGFTVIEGRAYPIQVELAYAPFLDAFGPLLRGFSSARLKVLVNGLPDLGRLFPGLRLPPSSLPEGLGDPAVEKTRLFEAVTRFLERLARKTPVALFLDDVHWADRATLELLHYLARGLADQRVLLLAAYGADALDTSRRLRPVVESLLRGGLAEEIVVSRLGPEAVDKLVRRLLDGEPPAGLLALLETRAGGIPLFIEALIYALIDSGNLVRSARGWNLDVERGMALPPTVRHLILGRLERLTPAERQIVDLIAIMAEATSHTTLRAVSSLDEKDLLEILRRLEASGLVVEGMDDSEVMYSLSHPLVQEVAYADLPEMERRRVHMAAIKVIETHSEGRADDPSVGSGQALKRLAHHYHGAGPEANRDRTMAVLIAAGERARALYANEEAARHYSAALAMVREGRGLRVEGGASPPSTLHPLPSTLLEKLGEAWERIGKHEAAVGVWNEAVLERERAGDVIDASRLRYRLSMVELDRARFAIANCHLQAGLALLAEGLAGREPCQELVDLHYARCQLFIQLGDVAGAADAIAEIMSVVEKMVSPRAEAQASLVAAIYSLWQDDLASAQARCLHALAVGEAVSEGQEPAICCRACSILALVAMRHGDHHSVRHHAQHGLALAQRLGAPTMEVLLNTHLVYASFMAGAWDQSLRHSIEAIALARRVGHPRDLAYLLAGRGLILALQGDLPEAEACISEARLSWRSATPAGKVVFGLVDIAEGTLALERGQVDYALSSARGFNCPTAPAAGHSGLTFAAMPRGLMLLAEAQVAAGEPESALETALKLNKLSQANTPYLTALVSRAEGLARQALGQREVAVVCLMRAHEIFTTLDMPFEAARCLLEQAEVRGQESGIRGQAGALWARNGGDGSAGCPLAPDPRPLSPIQAAGQSLAIFERLGAQRYADRARRLLRGLGVSPPALHRTRLTELPLSRREKEIALLVANGLTTPEIAKRLIISSRTVTTHLEHIYARLGIGSRAALARMVAEAGLLSAKDEDT